MGQRHKKTRLIEMMICETGGGGDCGTWATEYVEIPASTKKRDIAKRACDVMGRQLADRDNIAHIAVYNIPDQAVRCKLCACVGDADDYRTMKSGFVCNECWDPGMK